MGSGTWIAQGAAVRIKAMRTSAALLPILLMSFSMRAFADPTGGTETEVKLVRVENVGMKALGYDELTTGNSNKDERMVRVVALASNGRYLVAVRSNIGIVRMKGAYLDSALTVEDGKFTFYYANGRVESDGNYVRGSKSGTWMRYTLDGEKLAERNYTGMNTQELLVAVGAAKTANRVAAKHPSSIAQVATRRSSTPVEF